MCIVWHLCKTVYGLRYEFRLDYYRGPVKLGMCMVFFRIRVLVKKLRIIRRFSDNRKMRYCWRKCSVLPKFIAEKAYSITLSIQNGGGWGR